MLTRRQRDLLTYLDAYQKTRGYSPSFDEMKDALNLRSKSGVHRMVEALEERGFIRRLRYHARAIEVIRLPGDTVIDQARLGKAVLAMVKVVSGAPNHKPTYHGLALAAVEAYLEASDAD